MSEPYELAGLVKDGTTFPMLVMGLPWPIGGLPASVSTLICFSAQRQIEHALK